MVLAALRFGATVLPIPFRAISASIAPLDVHEYIFGCKSCRTRLAFEWVRSAAAPSRSAVSHCWSSSSRVAAFRPSSRANRQMLSVLLRASHRTILRRRNTDFLVLCAPRGNRAEPHFPIALSSALNAAALLLTADFLLYGRESWRGGFSTRFTHSTRLIQNEERRK